MAERVRVGYNLTVENLHAPIKTEAAKRFKQEITFPASELARVESTY